MKLSWSLVCGVANRPNSSSEVTSLSLVTTLAQGSRRIGKTGKIAVLPGIFGIEHSGVLSKLPLVVYLSCPPKISVATLRLTGVGSSALKRRNASRVNLKRRGAS